MVDLATTAPKIADARLRSGITAARRAEPRAWPSNAQAIEAIRGREQGPESQAIPTSPSSIRLTAVAAYRAAANKCRTPSSMPSGWRTHRKRKKTGRSARGGREKSLLPWRGRRGRRIRWPVRSTGSPWSCE